MKIFDSFNIEVEDIGYKTLIDKFEHYFAGRENKTILCHRFLNLKQKEDEEIHEFIQRVLNQTGQCQLGTLKNDLAIHLIINKLQQEDLKTELLKKADITMDHVNTTCAMFELAARTLRALESKRGIEKVDEKIGAEKGATCVEISIFHAEISNSKMLQMPGIRPFII